MSKVKGESRELFEWVKATSENLPELKIQVPLRVNGFYYTSGRYNDNSRTFFSIEGKSYEISVIEWLKPIPQSSLKEDSKIVVWKDGSYLKVQGETWEYENDENWLTTIKI